MTSDPLTTIQNYLNGMDYPANKEDLIEYVQVQDAEDDILEFLEQLPDEQEFYSLTEVSQAISEIE